MNNRCRDWIEMIRVRFATTRRMYPGRRAECELPGQRLTDLGRLMEAFVVCMKLIGPLGRAERCRRRGHRRGTGYVRSASRESV